jgi:hypothetical protein
VHLVGFLFIVVISAFVGFIVRTVYSCKVMNSIKIGLRVLNESHYEEAVREFPSPILICWTHININTFSQYQYCIEMPVWMHIYNFSQCADFLNDRTSEADSLTDDMTISWPSRSIWVLTPCSHAARQRRFGAKFCIYLHRIQLATNFTLKSIIFTNIYTAGRA